VIGRNSRTGLTNPSAPPSKPWMTSNNALFHRLVETAVAARGEIPPKSPESLYWGVDAVFQGVMARIAAGGLGLDRHATPTLETYSEHVVEFIIIAGLLGRFPDPGPEASS